jgi:tRNA nucleotidyltransferase (CCA-adding enzyme)
MPGPWGFGSPDDAWTARSRQRIVKAPESRQRDIGVAAGPAISRRRLRVRLEMPGEVRDGVGAIHKAGGVMRSAAGAPGASPGRWAHFAHGADIGVHGMGTTRAEAFRQAAVALTAVVTDPAAVRAVTRVPIACSAPDDELLLVEWLNAVVFEMATRGMLFADFEVAFADHSLTGVACGEPIDPVRHQPAVEVKGATCTALSVEYRDGLWHARSVVDV